MKLLSSSEKTRMISNIPGDVTHRLIGKWAVGLQFKDFLAFSVSISLKILQLGASTIVEKPERAILTNPTNFQNYNVSSK